MNDNEFASETDEEIVVAVAGNHKTYRNTQWQTIMGAFTNGRKYKQKYELSKGSTLCKMLSKFQGDNQGRNAAQAKTM
jgi:hypothetical protein